MLLSLAAPAVAAPLMPPDAGRTIGTRLSFDGLVDEAGNALAEASERDAESGDDRPWIVSPMYTSCPHTCSAITNGVRSALAESGLAESEYRALSFSFDPSETAESLRVFRQRMRLPASWLTLRASDARALARLLDAMDFRTMQTADGEYQHPNLVAVLSADRRLAGYVFGVKPSSTELANLVRSARDGIPGSAGWGMLLFFFAAIGLLVSTFVFVWLLVERRSRPAVEAKSQL